MRNRCQAGRDSGGPADGRLLVHALMQLQPCLLVLLASRAGRRGTSTRQARKTWPLRPLRELHVPEGKHHPRSSRDFLKQALRVTPQRSKASLTFATLSSGLGLAPLVLCLLAGCPAARQGNRGNPVAHWRAARRPCCGGGPGGTTPSSRSCNLRATSSSESIWMSAEAWAGTVSFS